MRRNLYITLIMFITFNLALSQGTISVDARMSRISYLIDSLSVFADGFPPTIEDSIQIDEVKVFYSSIVDSLTAIEVISPRDAKLQAKIGEVYRMGHNLDVEEAWEHSESHLRKAVELDPDSPAPYFSLGLLYVNSDLRLAPKAEKMFLKTLELVKDKPMPYAYQGLAFACYYQGKMEEALRAINTFLQMKPGDEQAIRMREIIKKKSER